MQMGRPLPCEASFGLPIVPEFYPRLRNGSYTLLITFMPRGFPQKAVFSAIRLTLAPCIVMGERCI